MNKSLIINVYKTHKFMAWFSNNSVLSIHGFENKKEADIWLDLMIKRNNFICTFGIYNDCNFELINRILKAEEII